MRRVIVTDRYSGTGCGLICELYVDEELVALWTAEDVEFIPSLRRVFWKGGDGFGLIYDVDAIRRERGIRKEVDNGER